MNVRVGYVGVVVAVAVLSLIVAAFAVYELMRSEPETKLVSANRPAATVDAPPPPALHAAPPAQAITDAPPAHHHDAGEETVMADAVDPAREQQMRELGYHIPPEYHAIDLSTLQAMAINGDVAALMHLGERYAFDIGVNPQHPDRRSTLNYSELAKKAFREAMARGNRHAAAVLAELHLIEQNPVEAVAWHLLAEQQGDAPAVDWFRRTKDWQSLKPEDLAKAQTRAALLSKEQAQLQDKLFPGRPSGA